MRSQDLWKYLFQLLDKSFNSNITPEIFVDFYNVSMPEYMDFCLGSMRDYVPGRSVSRNSPEESARAMDAIAPFWKPRFAVPVVNGVARVNQGDFYGAYRLYVPGYENPACGQPSPVPYEIPIEEVPMQEWPTRTNHKSLKYMGLKKPGYIKDSELDVRICPKTITSIWATYLRKPRPITLATMPDGTVDMNASNDDPEWRDIDAIAILDSVIWKCGNREQVSSWIQYSQMKQAR